MNTANCGTLNIAHRGARSLAPENTLAAAQKGLDIGADMWELDVGMTADGELIVIHDDTLERTSNAAEVFPQRAPWRVHEFTFAEIRQLDFGSWFVEQDPFEQIAAGNITQADLESYRGEPAPTLREALEFTRQHNWRMNIEIKNLSNTPGDAAVVEKVVALVEELGMAEQVLISSFNHSYLEQVKAINPNLATGALVWNPVIDTVALLNRLDVQVYNPADHIIEPEAIANLRQQGFEVNVFTVNDEARMKTLVEAGASGIFTDFPQLLKPIIDACR